MPGTGAAGAAADAMPPVAVGAERPLEPRPVLGATRPRIPPDVVPPPPALAPAPLPPPPRVIVPAVAAEAPPTMPPVTPLPMGATASGSKPEITLFGVVITLFDTVIWLLAGLLLVVPMPLELREIGRRDPCVALLRFDSDVRGRGVVVPGPLVLATSPGRPKTEPGRPPPTLTMIS